MKRSLIAVLISALLSGCGGGLLPAAKAATTPSLPELRSVRIGAVAIDDFIQLPLSLAQQLGYFSAAGVSVRLVDYQNGVAALNGLARGDVDLVSIPYEFTIRAQLSGSALTMVALYDLRPGSVLSVGRPHLDAVHSMRDLVGKPVCVSALATASEAFVRWLAVRDGVDPASIPVQACGILPERYAALLASGAVWAAQQVDPPFTRLQRQGTATALYDVRSEAGARQVYGGRGIYPTNGLIASPEFMRKYPNTTRALVGALVKALRYIHTHSASQIADQMPPAYKTGDAELYASSLATNLGMFSTDGAMPDDGPSTVLQVLTLVLPAASSASIDLRETYDNRFVRAAAAG